MTTITSFCRVWTHRRAQDLRCQESNFVFLFKIKAILTLLIRNTDKFLLRKSMDWFLYDIGLCHERVKTKQPGQRHNNMTSLQKLAKQLL